MAGSKTGGGQGTNQYQVKGASKAVPKVADSSVSNGVSASVSNDDPFQQDGPTDPTCSECGIEVTVDENGVAFHDDGGGWWDDPLDADLDHVPIPEDQLVQSGEPVTETPASESRQARKSAQTSIAKSVGLLHGKAGLGAEEKAARLGEAREGLKEASEDVNTATSKGGYDYQVTSVMFSGDSAIKAVDDKLDSGSGKTPRKLRKAAGAYARSANEQLEGEPGLSHEERSYRLSMARAQLSTARSLLYQAQKDTEGA